MTEFRVVAVVVIAAVLLWQAPQSHASAIPTPSGSGLTVDPVTGLFIDKVNRTRFFHGVNAIAKLAPYLPDTEHADTTNSLTDKDLRMLHDDWGFNAIRLGVMWVAVEGVQGETNHTYLKILRNISDRMFHHGIYTLLDGHQDLLGPDLCGEGFPQWAMRRLFEYQHFDIDNPFTRFPLPLPFHIPRDPVSGLPDHSQCIKHLFIDFYSSFGTSTAFGSLYKSVAIQKLYAQFWSQVATAFLGAQGLMAFEVLNEPGPGDIYNIAYWPKDRQALFPLYNTTHHAIREVDNDTLIFYEGIPTDQYIGEYLHGFTDLLSPSGPGGKDFADREALAFHLYCPPNSNEILCDGIIDLAWAWLNRTKTKMTEGTHASIMTEFGSVGDQDSDVRLLNKLTSAADHFLQSWFYWTYRSYGDITTQNPSTETFFHPNGSIQELKVKALSTTYPHAVAGAADSISFRMDRSTGDFELNYTTIAGEPNTSECNHSSWDSKLEKSCADSTSTEIFLNEKMWYPTGFHVRLQVLQETGLRGEKVWLDAEKANVLSWYVKRKNYIIIEHRKGTIRPVKVFIFRA